MFSLNLRTRLKLWIASDMIRGLDMSERDAKARRIRV